MRIANRVSLERIAALDRAVRAGEYPNAATIARALEVSPRTVQRDIEFLRDRFGAPLEFDARRNGYRYRDPTYRLAFPALTEGELVALFLAERVLAQYRGTPYARELARAYRKLTLGLTERVTIDLGHLGESHSFRTTAPADLDPGLFRDLAVAVGGSRRVVLDYWTASRDERLRRVVDPYHLAAVDGQWYLIGHCHLRGEVRMFAPARIRGLEVTDETFDRPERFRVDDYLAGSFGVLRGGAGEVHRVRLRITGPSARYVRERTWHPSQSIAPDGDAALILALEVGHLREVERWALSWGPDCEVLEPAELRTRVAAALAAAAARYLHAPGATDDAPPMRSTKSVEIVEVTPCR